MPKKEKKTEDISEYQKAYRAAHPKDKAAVNEYMKKYIKEAESIDCPVCGGHFKSYAKYKHDKSQKHIKALIDIKDKAEKEELKRKEEEAQKKALEEAEAERNKPKKTIKIKMKKKKVEEKKENIKMEIKEKPVPAPRKPKEKPAALKALEEYSSSSSSESEEEVEEKLEDTKVRLQSKTIDSEAITKYIQEHFEASANPARSTENKTRRQNKDAALWKKVSKELDGKTFKYLGDHFGEIVSKAYPKPTSQADLISILKRVIVKFSKLPAPEEKRINMLARKLKESHISKQK